MENNYFQIVFNQSEYSNSQNNIASLQFSKYKCKVINNILQVELNQRFQNLSQSQNNEQVEAIYSIPVNENTCLESFEATMNGQVMKGYVKGKEESASLYDKGKEDGNIVGYCEKKLFDKENSDSLHIKIGNIPQNVFVDITLKYSQQISCILNSFYFIDIIALLKEDGQQNNVPSFSMNLQCSQKITYYKSFGFQTDILLIDDNTLDIQSNKTIQNQNQLQKNFKFLFQFENMHEPQVLYGKCESMVSLGNSNQNKQIELENYLIQLSFIPDFNKNFKSPITDTINASLAVQQDILNDEYLQSFNESIIDQFEASKSEFIFLLDRSWSMNGQSIDQAKESLILFIKSLPQNSYFNVISFGSSYELMFEHSKQYSDESINQSIEKIKTYDADLLGTDIYAPLEFIYNHTQRINGYGRQIYLLTDGGIDDKEQVLKLIRDNRIGNRVHSIGIGSCVDSDLIIQSAKTGKGCYKIVNDEQSLQESIIYLLQNSISPILEQFQIKYNSQIFTSQYPNNSALSCIFKDDLFNLFLFLQPGVNIDDLTDQDKTINISYFDTSCNQLIEKQFLLNPQDAHRFDQQLSRSVFKIGMHFKLNQSNKNESESQNKEKIQQSIEHQILTQQTSYFCEIEKINDEKRVKYWIPETQLDLKNTDDQKRVMGMGNVGAQRHYCIRNSSPSSSPSPPSHTPAYTIGMGKVGPQIHYCKRISPFSPAYTLGMGKVGDQKQQSNRISSPSSPAYTLGMGKVGDQIQQCNRISSPAYTLGMRKVGDQIQYCNRISSPSSPAQTIGMGKVGPQIHYRKRNSSPSSSPSPPSHNLAYTLRMGKVEDQIQYCKRISSPSSAPYTLGTGKVGAQIQYSKRISSPSSSPSPPSHTPAYTLGMGKVEDQIQYCKRISSPSSPAYTLGMGKVGAQIQYCKRISSPSSSPPSHTPAYTLAYNPAYTPAQNHVYTPGSLKIQQQSIIKDQYRVMNCLRQDTSRSRSRSNKQNILRQQVQSRSTSSDEDLNISSEKDRSMSREKQMIININEQNTIKKYQFTDIINLVTSKGAWTYKSEIVQQFISKDKKNIIDNVQKEFKSNDLFMTFFMLWVLENVFKKEKNQWILISKKTMKFIEKEIPDIKEVEKLKQSINNLCLNN